MTEKELMTIDNIQYSKKELINKINNQSIQNISVFRKAFAENFYEDELKNILKNAIHDEYYELAATIHEVLKDPKGIYKKILEKKQDELIENFVKNKVKVSLSREILLKLEKENFKIDSTNWKEIQDLAGVKVLVNPEGDVWEYLEGNSKGEQLFTGPEYKNGKLIKEGSAIRETKKAGKKLPTSANKYKKLIRGKKIHGGYGGDYLAFLIGEGYLTQNRNATKKFSGWRNADDDMFNDIDREFSMWCEDGTYFYGDRMESSCVDGRGSDGRSVRCLQDY
ncbi:MAG: hypothetical protein WC010_04555 [Candidatus Absconditabacterales bacterium]